MSESEDSITWSNSVDSYFSSDTSSEHCPRPGRLMDLIAEKFRLMKCVNREHQQPATIALQVVMTDQAEERSKNLHPQRLASLLKEKLERLNVSKDDDENLAGRSPRRVTFPDQPSSSSSTSSNLIVQLMDVDVHVQARSGAHLLPSSSNAAQETIQEGNSVEMMLTEQEKSIFVLNFPDINVIVDGNEISQPNVGECASAEAVGKREVILYGRGTVSFCEREFETVAVAGEPHHDQEFIRIEREASTQSTMTSPGVVQQLFDVLPSDAEIGANENMDYAK